MGEALRLVVLGDSTTFTADSGPLMPDDPVLYPNVLAGAIERALDRRVARTVIAMPGTVVRDTWRSVTKDRHVMFDVLAGADAVVVGVGSFDHAPAGVPAPVEALVPYLRPAGVRRRVRAALRRAQPVLARATGSRLTRTPRGEFARLYDAVLLQVRGLTHGAPGAVMGPTSHRAAYYGNRHPTHRDRESLQREIAGRHGFPFVAAWDLVEPYAEKLNVDGIHWPPEAHDAVGRALAERLVPQLRGTEPAPPNPWDAGR